jgi:hypothetical protein
MSAHKVIHFNDLSVCFIMFFIDSLRCFFCPREVKENGPIKQPRKALFPLPPFDSRPKPPSLIAASRGAGLSLAGVPTSYS